MKKIKIGIIREGKMPPDKRVPLTPVQCKKLMNDYPELEICVQPSPIRCFANKEYLSEGLILSDDLSKCDILIGVKEVPVNDLIADKTYLFFSHTIKEQPYNRKLLQSILQKNIRLVDYECLTSKKGFRIIGFGRYAGIVGCYNGFLTYGKKFDLYDLKPAHQCENRLEMEDELKKVKLSDIKIVLTGDGRVANGAIEIMQKLNIKEVTPDDILNNQYNEPVYAQLSPQHYVKSKDSSEWDLMDFFKNPKNYQSTFIRYAKIADMYIACHYWHPDSPVFFSKEDMKSDEFNVKVVADISCDINGPVACTVRPSTIENPIYEYDPLTEKEVDYKQKSIAVMSVDNLPCELPKDASKDFGEQLINHVFPYLFGEDKDSIINRATITKDGKLTKDYEYLSEYVNKRY